jgi:hypothetical protein
MPNESGGKTMDTLTLIDELRARGVTYFKEGDLELHMGPLPDPEESVKPIDSTSENREAPKLGKDGLTAEQQLDNYGVVIDAK